MASTIRPPFGQLLCEIPRADVSRSAEEPKITGCEYVASYSWTDRRTPTIMVPGKPPAWTRPAADRYLRKDQGDFFRDPNAARFPRYPMEPAVRAVLKQRPEFSTEDVDIFTCSSVFQNLSRFIRGVDKEFRFIIEKVENTIFFVRRENSPTEVIPNIKGYGHAFLEEYTTWERDVKDSVSHQRIIRYSFGDLRLLMRFESDGYRRRNNAGVPVNDSTSLTDQLGGTSITHSTPTSQGALRIKEAGREISQAEMFDVKTRSAFDFDKRKISSNPTIDMTDITPKLWASQIPTLIVGFHNRGLFANIQTRDVRKEVQAWEQQNGQAHRKLLSILHRLIEIVTNHKEPLEVYRSESGPLQVRRLAPAGNAPRALPNELIARWKESIKSTKKNDGARGGDSARGDSSDAQHTSTG